MKFRTDEKITITKTIRRPKKKTTGKGIIDSDEVVEYLPRRKPGGIRFFDCGYYADGTMVDWIDPLSAVPITGNPPLSTYNNIPTSTTLALYEDAHDEVFTEPVADFATVYKQIDNSYFIGGTQSLFIVLNEKSYSVFEDSDVWRNNTFYPDGSGLPSAGTQFQLGYTFGGVYIDVATKITSTRDFAASAVPLTLGNSFDVFVMPHLFYLEGRTTWTIGTPQTSGQQRILNGFYFLPSRDIWLDSGHPYYDESHLIFGGGVSWSSGEDATEYTNAFNSINFIRDVYPYRAIQRDYSDPPDAYSFSYPSIASFIDTSVFPAPPTLPATGSYSAMQLDATSINQAPSFAGALLAVIKKGGQYYYVWSQ